MRLRPSKTFGHDVIQEGKEQFPIAAGIDEENGLGVEVELLPAEYLERLVESSYAARQNRESVCALGHYAFSLVHAVDNDQFGGPQMSQFGIPQPCWNDPDHLSSTRQDRVGEQTHEPDPPAAVN